MLRRIRSENTRRGLLLAVTFFCLLVGAEARPETPIARPDFESLAADLAVKVTLFRDVWAQDPNAELFGGTSRDFLYWIKGQLRSGKTAGQLRALPSIDVRDFITGESDIDVLSDRGIRLDAAAYGVKKIDVIDKSRLDPSTPFGKTERDQGYIPVEKIRVGRSGIVPWTDFGDGVGEVLSGKLTATFAPQATFEQTHYARLGMNHPVLLAMRFLRLLATDYYYENGRSLPDASKLFDVDPKTAADVKRTLAEAATDPKLARLLRNPNFAKKLNDTVHKAFRTYTSPSAALALFRHFGADKVVANHDGIEPINQYLFAQYRDREAIERRLRAHGVDTAAFFADPKSEFPDGKLYHGTRTEESFRALLLVGILPSERGTAGAGLYAVSQSDIPFAERWGNSAERVVSLPVKPGARVVDITHGEGKRIFDSLGKTPDAFAEYFGIDILRYPYPNSPHAYVVKNSEALGAPQGHTRQIMTVGRFLEMAQTVRDSDGLARLVQSMKINQLNNRERVLILDQTPYLTAMPKNPATPAEIAHLINALKATDLPAEAILQRVGNISSPEVQGRLALLAVPLQPLMPKDSAEHTIDLIQLFALLDHLRTTPDPVAERQAAALWKAMTVRLEIAAEDQHHSAGVRRRYASDAKLDELPLVEGIKALLTTKNAKADGAWLQARVAEARAEVKARLQPAVMRWRGRAVAAALFAAGGFGAGALMDAIAGTSFMKLTMGFGGSGFTMLGTWAGNRIYEREAREAMGNGALHLLDKAQLGALDAVIAERIKAARKAPVAQAPVPVTPRAPRYATIEEYFRDVNMHLRMFEHSMTLLEEAFTLADNDNHYLKIVELADLMWDGVKRTDDPRPAAVEHLIRKAVAKLSRAFTGDVALVNRTLDQHLIMRATTREIILERAIQDISNASDLQRLALPHESRRSGEFSDFLRASRYRQFLPPEPKSCFAFLAKLFG